MSNSIARPAEPGATARWRAWHIHLPHSLQTPFLCDGVAPVVRRAGNPRFFYLRYWQGGPHLRLRVHGLSPRASEAFRAELAAALPPVEEAAAAAYATAGTLQGELAALEGEEVLPTVPAGTILTAEYTPETDKYGGTGGLAVAERLFCDTSAASLEVLATARSGRGTEPIGEAMRVVAVSLAGFGLDMPAASEFLHAYEDFWRRYVPAGYDEMWERLHVGLSAAVAALCSESFTVADDNPFRGIYARAREDWERIGGANTETAMHSLANYLHTTNNRLGLIPATEAFLAHELRRALEAMVAD